MQRPESALDSSQEQTTIIGLYLMLGLWPLSAADQALSAMSGSAAASTAKPKLAGTGLVKSDAGKESHQAADVASRAVSPAAPSAAAAASVATFASSFNHVAATAPPDSASRGLSAYTEPFYPGFLHVFPIGVDEATIAAVSEQHIAKHTQNIAGLPKLHASALEVVCLSGLLTATQIDSYWEADGHEIYEHCVRWFIGFVAAWLLEFAGGKSEPDQYQLPPLEAHIRMICQ